MKNRLLLFTMLFIASLSNAQDDDPILSDAQTESGITIPLYQIDLDGINIPINLTYNSAGIKVSEVPSPVGVSWKLNDIGKITRIVNHKPDEYVFSADRIQQIQQRTLTSLQDQIQYINGWFFSTSNNPTSYIGTSASSVSVYEEIQLTEFNASEFYNAYVDCTPDFFMLNTATGLHSSFYYKKNFSSSNTLLDPSPMFLDRNANFLLDTHFDKFHYGELNTTDIVFDVTLENSLKYSFIGGLSTSMITRSGSNLNKKDFYLKKISTVQNSDVVTIDYISNETSVFQYIESGRKSTVDNAAIQVMRDYGFEENGTLEISKITTPRETINFIYSNGVVGVVGSYSDQTVKRLTSIEIKDPTGEFITGYNFYYHFFSDNRFILRQIDKINKSNSAVIKIWEMEYYTGSPNDAQSLKYDMFGYSIQRPGTNNTALLHQNRVCNGTTTYSGGDRSPHFEGILPGMLKKIYNNLGGNKEYLYQLNASEEDHNEYYGGGLKISKIIDTPEVGKTKTTTFAYNQIRGKVYNLTPSLFEFEGDMPNATNLVSNMPVSFHDVETQGPDPYYFPDFDTHITGNYFSKVTTSTFLEVEDVRDVYLTLVYEYIPSWKGVIRRPLLSKKKAFKSYFYQGVEEGAIPLSEEERIYDFISTGVTQTRSNIRRTSNTNACGSTMNITTHVFIDRKPIYIFLQPLKTIINREYKYDNMGYQTSIETTKTQMEYIGEGQNASFYQFDELLPKQITVYKNNIPVSRGKHTYLCEMFTPTAGLSNLSQFSSQGFTLPSEDSQWTYSLTDKKWVLQEAEFFEFNSDGKARGTFKVHKNQATNTFYDESNYSPYYSAGSVAGVSRENEITLNYDTNGKLSSVVDFENGKVKMFSRKNDRDTYSINTVLVGNRYLLSNYDFYRNSFETLSINYLATPLAYTGKKVYNGSTLRVGTYPAGYVVSFWHYSGNKWQFSSSVHTGGTLIIAKPVGAVYIDEVWVRPPNTDLTGFTFDPLIGATSTIEDGGQVIKTIYDEFGRAVKQADQDNNLLLKKEYNLTND
jgi:hypothetical protein